VSKRLVLIYFDKLSFTRENEVRCVKALQLSLGLATPEPKEQAVSSRKRIPKNATGPINKSSIQADCSTAAVIKDLDLMYVTTAIITALSGLNAGR
jgi:hypothetical protein